MDKIVPRIETGSIRGTYPMSFGRWTRQRLGPPSR